MMNIKEYIRTQASEIEALLEKTVDGISKAPSQLVEAMKYSLTAGGKRLRPIMMREAAKACGIKSIEETDTFAVAMEMIHTFSLIHDDLPALDNDDLRRGRPTNHKQFGEALAILAGDGLQSYANEIMSKYVLEHTEQRFARAQYEINRFSGISGMIGGETVDVLAEKIGLDISNEKDLTNMYAMKTCDLLMASVRAGAIIAGADDETVNKFGEYGYSVGLAFQIVDDILDVIGDEKLIGKNVGSDIANDKMTFVKLFGLEKAKDIADKLTGNAIEIATELKSDFFAELAKYLADRNN